MSIQTKLFYLLLAILAVVLLPLAGEYIHSGGHIPADYFKFPTLSVPAKAPFNIWVFMAVSVCCLVVVLLYVYPWAFGFRKPPEISVTTKPAVKLPMWFWLGIVLFIPTAIILWAKLQGPKFILNFAAIPLFWGIALIIDSIVYLRTGGNSFVAKRPRTLLAIGLTSISGWLIFEYLNFFVEENWYYPKGNLVGESAFLIYAIIGSAGLMPILFEVYHLLTSCRKLNTRYSYGPKITIGKTVLWAILIVCLTLIFFVGYLPNSLFFLMWVGPLIVFAIVLDMLKIWTPFTPIAKYGDWTPLALIGLAEFITGLLCECLNFMSAKHDPFVTFNPDYWKYSLPYVDTLHVFEMPLLGLFGYFPFGIYSWVWFILFTFILNIPPYLGDNKSYTGIGTTLNK